MVPMEASSRCCSASSSAGAWQPFLVQFLAQAQFQFARRFVRERHRDDVVDRRFPCAEHRDDALHQFRGLAGAGRRFDDQAFVQRIADALARRFVGFEDAGAGSCHSSDFGQRIQSLIVTILFRRSATLRRGRTRAGNRNVRTRPSAARAARNPARWTRRCSASSFARKCAGALCDRNLRVLVFAALRRVKQPSGFDFRAEQLPAPPGRRAAAARIVRRRRRPEYSPAACRFCDR